MHYRKEFHLQQNVHWRNSLTARRAPAREQLKKGEFVLPSAAENPRRFAASLTFDRGSELAMLHQTNRLLCE